MAKTEIDKDLIRELAALMEETGLSEIEIERDDDRMRLVRATAPAAVAVITGLAVASFDPITASRIGMASLIAFFAVGLVLVIRTQGPPETSGDGRA